MKSNNRREEDLWAGRRGERRGEREVEMWWRMLASGGWRACA